MPLVEDAGEAVLVRRVLYRLELVDLHDREPAEVGQHLDHRLRFPPPPPRPGHHDDAVQAVARQDGRSHVHMEARQGRRLGRARRGVELGIGQGAPRLRDPSGASFPQRDLRPAGEGLGEGDPFGQGQLAVRAVDEHRRLLGLEQLLDQVEDDGHHGPPSGGGEQLRHEIGDVGQGLVLGRGRIEGAAARDRPGRDEADQDPGGDRRPQ